MADAHCPACHDPQCLGVGVPLWTELHQIVAAELHQQGCRCERPLIGWTPGRGPRCRLCQTEMKAIPPVDV